MLHRLIPARMAAVAALMAASGGLALADDCKSPQTNNQMIECADRDYKAADAALNAAYQEVLKNLRSLDRQQGGTELEAALRTAQRAWIGFRDGQCAWEADFFDGGSMQPVIHLTCLTGATETRTKQIRETWKTYGSE